MSRLIFVNDTGDDLDGDGTADNPFATEDRAELDAGPGDVILIYDNEHPLDPAVVEQDIRAAATPTPTAVKRRGLWPSTRVLRGYLFGVMVGVVAHRVHSPAIVLILSTVATAVVLILGRDD